MKTCTVLFQRYKSSITQLILFSTVTKKRRQKWNKRRKQANISIFIASLLDAVEIFHATRFAQDNQIHTFYGNNLVIYFGEGILTDNG